MRQSKKEPAFPSEAAMCQAFVVALPKEWTAYNETAGWDILLVRAVDGFQIGIEAKLRLGLEVINQAIEDHWGYHRERGPDCRAVLVPEGSGPAGLTEICAYIGITVIRMRPAPPRGVWHSRFEPSLPDSKGRGEHPAGHLWYELCPTARHKLPEYVPDVAAGASAPVQLTDWKIRAIKVAIILDRREFVTRADFRVLGLDHRRWLAQEWLRPREGVWIRGAMPDFRAQHPVVYEQIAADAPKWMPPTALLVTAPQQEVLL